MHPLAMNRLRPFRHLVAKCALLSLAATTFAADKPAESRFTLNWSDQGVEVSEGGNKVFFYQRAPKSLYGRYSRANYLHPVYDLDGKVITEDFPKDHFHHRGIFWAWHHFTRDGESLGDPWSCQDIVWDVVNVEQAKGKDRDSVTLKADVVWKSKRRAGSDPAQGVGEQLQPLVLETTLIRVHKAAANHRLIDFETHLRALVPGLELGGSGDAKGYGGFSTRIKLPDDLQFVGRNGAIEPVKLAVEGGPWMDFSGSLNDTGKTTGLAILQHPTLPRFPQKWMLRRKTSMQNPQWPGNQPVAIPTDDSFVLRHRVVLHRGDAQAAGIDRLQREYEKEAKPLTRQKPAGSAPATLPGARTEIYRTVDGIELPIHIYEPKGHKSGDQTPAIVFFFGGGWKNGSPTQFQHHCRYLASRGMVAMTAEYRVLSRHGVRAIDCFMDAKAAIRWTRHNAERLGIDPQRLAAGGGSAGGHLAGALGTIPHLGDPVDKEFLSSVPNALALFNPALVLAPTGREEMPFDEEKLASMSYRMGVPSEQLSPWHNIAAHQPPAIIFHGKADPTVIYASAEWFTEKSRAAGNRCELVGYEDQVHGFFNYGKGGNKMFAATVTAMDKFLASLGWLEGEPTVEAFLAPDGK